MWVAKKVEVCRTPSDLWLEQQKNTGPIHCAGGTVREDTCLSGHVQFEVLARREVWEVGGSTPVGVRAGMEA